VVEVSGVFVFGVFGVYVKCSRDGGEVDNLVGGTICG